MKKLNLNPAHSPTLSECIICFERRCVAKNLSEHTLETYDLHCSLFLAFVGQEDILMKDLPPDVIEGYIAHLRQAGRCNDSTIASYMRTIRVFFYFCMEMGYILPI